jgi:hypothetical protein
MIKPETAADDWRPTVFWNESGNGVRISSEEVKCSNEERPAGNRLNDADGDQIGVAPKGRLDRNGPE